MTRNVIVDYWLEKATQDLASARDNLSKDRLMNAVRDAYFACFHAFSSVLLKDGKSFKRHKEVRSTLHRDYVRIGKVSGEWGKHYDWLFDNRQKADYRPLVRFDPDQVKDIVDRRDAFVKEMKKIVESS
jgi:uncharacterized protein (UPF0332 family)